MSIMGLFSRGDLERLSHFSAKNLNETTQMGGKIPSKC